MQKIVLSLMLVMAFSACNKNNGSNPPPPNNVYPDGNVPDNDGRIVHCHTRDDRGREYSYDVVGDPNDVQVSPGPRGSQVTRYTDARLTIVQDLGTPARTASQEQTLATVSVDVEVTQDPRGQKSYSIVADEDACIAEPNANPRESVQNQIAQGDEVLRVSDYGGERRGTSYNQRLPGMDHRQPMDCR